MQVRDTDFLLDGNAEERDGSFFCIPAIRAAGMEDSNATRISRGRKEQGGHEFC